MVHAGGPYSEVIYCDGQGVITFDIRYPGNSCPTHDESGSGVGVSVGEAGSDYSNTQKIRGWLACAKASSITSGPIKESRMSMVMTVPIIGSARTVREIEGAGRGVALNTGHIQS